MTGVPPVLGLHERDALNRLRTMGFEAVDVCVSGRRREGSPRVIRARASDGKAELVISYFKDMDKIGGVL